MKKQISQWFDNGCNYYEGVAIYSQYGKSKNLKKHFAKGESSPRIEKIKWELCKLAGLPESIVFQKPKPKKQPEPEMKKCLNCGRLIIKYGPKYCNNTCKNEYKLKQSQDPGSGSGSGDPTENQNAQQTPTVDVKPKGKGSSHKYKIPLELLPEVLQELIRIKSKLYNERAELHKKLDNVPEKNDLENITSRKAITSEMNMKTAHIDQIYNLIRFYENNIAIKKPSQEDLNKYNSIIYELTGVQIEDTISIDKEAGTGNLSGADLHKKLGNTRSSLSKDKKKVDGTFGLKKDAKTVPMPDGPKKDKIMARIKEKEALIKEIEEKLASEK